jgi:hypothetical protein
MPLAYLLNPDIKVVDLSLVRLLQLIQRLLHMRLLQLDMIQRLLHMRLLQLDMIQRLLHMGLDMRKFSPYLIC